MKTKTKRKVTIRKFKSKGYDKAKKKYEASKSMTPSQKIAALKKRKAKPKKSTLQLAREAVARHKKRNKK